MTSDTHATFAGLEKAGWSEPETAAAYARDFAKASDGAVPVLVNRSGAEAGLRVLDLCSGHGNVARGLAAVRARVTGLDFSPAMVALARANVPEAEFIEGDAGDLPFDDAQFDAVTCGFGMPHVPEPGRVLAEARRVLKPGGRIAYSVWQPPRVNGAFGWVFGAIGAHGAEGIALPPGPGATDYAEREIAFPALRAAGFDGIEIAGVSSGWRAEDPGTPYDFFLEGTVRGAAVLRRQPPGNAAAIRRAVVAKVIAELGERGPWSVPMPSVVVSAVAV